MSLLLKSFKPENKQLTLAYTVRKLPSGSVPVSFVFINEYLHVFLDSFRLSQSEILKDFELSHDVSQINYIILKKVVAAFCTSGVATQCSTPDWSKRYSYTEEVLRYCTTVHKELYHITIHIFAPTCSYFPFFPFLLFHREYITLSRSSKEADE